MVTDAGVEVSAGPAGAMEANKISGASNAQQTSSDAAEDAKTEDSGRLAAATEPSAQRHSNNSSLAAGGAAPATLHAAEMLIMAKEFVRIFREQHPGRRQPGLFAHTAAGQQVLLTQLLRPTQVPSRTH
jgi:hypothetical protein